jgi:3-hydroxyacyl-CoA dehydrogenase/3a,7a,12a-trihydroxy-5b-cholest-24-enoyl-CoA hydratase
MGETLRFDGRVAVVTGAGNGLGRAHALLLASRGAKVVVNDLGGSHTGGGKSSAAADKVVEEIRAAGGDAIANHDSVEEGGKIVQAALDSWKRIDIVINNAGILRDSSFQKLSEADWDLVYRVHVLGAFRVTHAAWPHMREAGYGRIVFTASAAGIYGNFGQTNYAMAKLGLVGLCNALAVEGAKKNVRSNTIAPIAGSRMTETVLPPELVAALKPEYVSPLVAWLAHEDCDSNGGLYEVGGGFMGRLRWERTCGKTWKLGRNITPENVRQSFDAICDFGQSTHPADINEALQPVMENLSSKSRGGNELIDLDLALGAPLPETTSRYDERDLALYALGVGAAQDPLDAQDLRQVYELHGDGFTPLPTYAVVPAVSAILKLAAEGHQAPGMSYGLDRILHGEQYLELFRPLPPRAQLKHEGRIKDIFDKGKNAVVVTEVLTRDADTGEKLARNEITTFIRGAGGWGGDRGPASDVNTPPDRAPDAVVTEKTHPNQALLYRLSGDWNPLHADPQFAQAFGFQKPILHGLCTFGYVGRHVIRSFAPNADPRYFKSIKVRFADSVFPGETLETRMWKESPHRVIVQTRALEREKVVISNAAVELYAEIPRPEKKAAAEAKAPEAKAAPPPAARTATGLTGQIFEAIGSYLDAHPELVGKVGNVYAFRLRNPDSAWTLDLKNAPGGVRAGAEKADCTLEMEDADWVAMATGKADPQKLYFGGKLKISGNVMASQKLDFLKKIDPAAAGAGATGGGSARAPAVFEALRARLVANPQLAGEVGAVLQFKVRDPEGAWVVDLRSGQASVTAGTTGEAAATLALSDEDLVALAKDPQVARDLYMHGKLRVDGDVAVAQRLGFLKQLV